MPIGEGFFYFESINSGYNWDEPIGNTLRANFDRMAEFASKNDAVVIQPVGESHFYSDLLSWKSINGMKPEELLPALMITSIHPRYFLARHDRQYCNEPIPEDELIFLKLNDTCKHPTDVIKLIEKIFQDIKEKKEIKDFQITKKQKAGVGSALVNALILEPNFAGVGVDLKKMFSIFRQPNA